MNNITWIVLLGVVLLIAGMTFALRQQRAARRQSHPDGIVLVSPDDPSNLSPEERKLTADQLLRVKRLSEAFGDAHQIGLDAWIAGFEADLGGPEHEIKLYGAIAVTYLKIIDGRTLTALEKQDLYNDLVILSLNPAQPIHSSTTGEAELPDWSTIVSWYRAARSAGSEP